MRTLLALGALHLGAPAFAADPVKRDLHGDPLPPGAVMRLGTLRSRAPISSFGIEKDGSVVTVSPRGGLRRWPAWGDRHESLIPLPELEDNGLGDQAQVSADGKLVAARVKNKVVVWEVPADAKTRPKEVAAFEIAGAKRFAFSPSGNQLIVATGSELWESIVRPHSVHLATIKKGKVTDLEGQSTYFVQVGFSGAGKRAVALTNEQVLVWETGTGKKLADFKVGDSWCDACALNFNGDLLIAQPHQSRVKFEWRFCDPLTGEAKAGLTPPQGGEWAAFAPDGKTILVGDSTGIQWWDPVAGKLLRRFDGDSHRRPAMFSPDGKTLVAACGPVLLRWDAATGKALFASQNSGHHDYVSGLGVSPDGNRVATRGFDDRLCVWDTETGRELWQASASWSSSPRVEFSPDGKSLFVPGAARGVILQRDAATGKQLRQFTLDPKKPKQPGVYSIRVSSDGKVVSALLGSPEAPEPSLLVAWNAETGERIRARRVYDSTRASLDHSPDAAYIAGSGEPAAVMPVAEQSVNLLKEANLRSGLPCCFSDDGKWLTLVALRNTPDGVFLYWAVVVSTETWKQVCAVQISGSGRAAVSPDGKTLATAHGEKLEFYDTVTSKLIGDYNLPVGEWKQFRTGYTPVLRFTPDGKKLITGHADTTALVWRVPERQAK